MDAGADDRLRSAVLVGMTLAVLVVGGWWWRSAAPVPAARPTATPTAEIATPIERALLYAEPDARVTVRIDETGEVVDVEGRRGIAIDPATGMVTDVDGAPGEMFYQPDSTGGLPRFNDTLWRVQATLTGDQKVVRQASAESGGRYLLQYRCTGSGAMRVMLTGAAMGTEAAVDCTGVATTGELAAAGGPIRVALIVAGGRSIDVEAQLVELP